MLGQFAYRYCRKYYTICTCSDWTMPNHFELQNERTKSIHSHNHIKSYFLSMAKYIFWNGGRDLKKLFSSITRKLGRGEGDWRGGGGGEERWTPRKDECRWHKNQNIKYIYKSTNYAMKKQTEFCSALHSYSFASQSHKYHLNTPHLDIDIWTVYLQKVSGWCQ